MTKNFELFFFRIKEATGTKTDKELGDFLGLNKSTLSMWKKREKVDYDLLFTKIEHVNFHWLVTGEGEMSIKPKSVKIEVPEQSYIIELQAELIARLKNDIKGLKKAQEPGSAYDLAAEPGSELKKK